MPEADQRVFRLVVTLLAERVGLVGSPATITEAGARHGLSREVVRAAEGPFTQILTRLPGETLAELRRAAG